MLSAIVQLVKQRFDAQVTHTDRVFGSVRGGCCAPEECRLSPEENWELTYGRVLRRVREQIPPQMAKYARLRLQPVEKQCRAQEPAYSLMGCSAGMDSYTLTWDGKLLGCQILESFRTDALELGFRKAWEQFPYTVQLPQENETCARCEQRQLCTVCPGVRMAECKNLTDIPQYICQCTKLTERRSCE